LMEIARQLIGEDIILWGTTIFGKPAMSGKETPWHQDGDYYPIRPLETMTIWIALDHVTEENGPMRFIPGSHKNKENYSHHRQENPDFTLFDVCDSAHFDESTAEDLIIEAGQVSYHDVYMIHGSKANQTQNRRAAFVVRLMPASSHYDHALGETMGQKNASHDYGQRPLFLVSGKDTSGKNNFEIGHA
jgi:ectoine hydroxylase-related dioxygenase (phytanoyl-CoA dioxygenase family)